MSRDDYNIKGGNEKTKMAGGPGFEPGLTESESAVLPLNDPPNQWSVISDQLSIVLNTNMKLYLLSVGINYQLIY